MLISGLRALRCAQQALTVSAAPALSVVWRGLASNNCGSGSSGGGSGQPPAANATEPGTAQGAASDASAASTKFNEHIISIDRSALYNPAPHVHSSRYGSGGSASGGDAAQAAAATAVDKEPETELVRHLKALIQFRGGPLTLAEFMSEALTNPQHGYYTQRDVFGAAGDFVTSPEISQMFGEMVGIWCVATWQQLGCPSELRIVELGPGRGTLMADLLRGTAAFQQFSQSLRVAMVEVSPHLRGMQWHALRCPGEPPPPPLEEAAAAATGPTGAQEEPQHGNSSSSSRDLHRDSSSGCGSSMDSSSSSSSESTGSSDSSSYSGISGWSGARVSWHRSLDDVDPAGAPTLYIAHEFLDALPVHQFQRTERGWCERLVDVAAHDSPLHLRMVLSPGPTPAARVLLPRRLAQLPPGQRQGLQALEVCPQGMAVAEALAHRVAQHGGAALIIDYGQDAPYEASLQAIRRHRFVGLLEQPGTADLSNRVDYSALRSTVADSCAAADCLGPIPQAHFLLGLGIQARLEALLKGATPQQAEALHAGFRRLVSGSEPGAALTDEGMGLSYQAFCIAQRGLQPWPFGVEVEEEQEQEEEREQQPQEQQQQQQQPPAGQQPRDGVPQ